MEEIVRRLMENKRVSMNISDSENQIQSLLETIEEYSKSGHSFNVVVDPGDSERRREFWIDGDGADRIHDIEIEEEEEE